MEKSAAAASRKGVGAASKSPEAAVRLLAGEETRARALEKKRSGDSSHDWGKSGAVGVHGGGGTAAAAAAAERATADTAAVGSRTGAVRAAGAAEAQQRGAAGAGAGAAAASAVEQGTEDVVFDKDLTVVLELQGDEPVLALELMRAVRVLCEGLVACRATGTMTFEVTMSHIKEKERLLDSFKIGQMAVLAKALCNDELVVSFLNLPAYITDSEIIRKLDSWGMTAASAIRRRMCPGTRIVS